MASVLPTPSIPSVMGPFMRIVLGVVVAFVCVKILIVLAVLWYCLRRSRANNAPPTTQAPSPTQTVLNSPEARPAPTATPVVPSIGSGVGRPDVAPQQDMACTMYVRKYSYADVEAISSNWMYELGKGGFGTVYYGEIFSPNAARNPQEVALKKLSAASRQGEDEFLNEVNLLSRIHFRYLVSLVGFCDEGNNKVLIYEYMKEGSLADWLRGKKRGHPDFSWNKRVLIALHAALGLDYLHTGARPNIIHRDVKSSNILITKDWEGRVADFGLSKTNGINDQDQPNTHTSTSVKGAFDYIDPEYKESSKLTTKSDVYSFGLVLLELVTGRHPTDLDDSQLQCIVQNHYPFDFADIADPNLKGKYDMRSLQKIAQVAVRSIAKQGKDRPSMRDVVEEIKSAMKLMAPAAVEDMSSPEAAPAANAQDFLIEFSTGPTMQTPHA